MPISSGSGASRRSARSRWSIWRASACRSPPGWASARSACRTTPMLFIATALEPVKLRGVGDAICFGRAWHEEFDLCVATSDGRVYASHRKAPEVTFVNTDLLRYLEFLVRAATMYRLWDEAAQGGPAESEGYLDELERWRRELTEVDPAALVEGAWWTGVWDDLKLI